MGSGKSTVGARLAERLGWAFVDLDAEIVRTQGQAIAEVFRNQGEAHFRQVEHEALLRILNMLGGPTVIALGGGTFIQERNRDLLCQRGATTIYLSGEFAVLLERCGAEQGTRPLAQDIEEFRKLHADRQPIYRSAELTVEIGNRSPEEISSEIVATLEKRNSQSAVPE
ncbi:shikimate kinase [Candidatus Koribacter versatilis Ellin345]|uniref:Shikimate kinase n=1 Tax=Koribacter versatilis (strain Ellin345) TaxID=204669 RepID=Q1INR1_KORVE|nr:shikimate kinase [Candidatus Koribacter versatilis Ellin345]